MYSITVKGPVSSFEVAVDFINLTVAECPHLFMPCPPEDTQQTPGLSQQARHKETVKEKEAYG